MAAGASPKATEAAAPEDDPPGTARSSFRQGGRCGDRVQAKTREGQFRHVGFAKADKALQRRGFQHGRVLCRGAVLQKGGPCLGRDAGGIEQVFPADRHAVQQAPAQARLGAGGGGHRLAPCAGGGGAGVDAGACGWLSMASRKASVSSTGWMRPLPISRPSSQAVMCPQVPVMRFPLLRAG
jgi:hypothetical protein